VFSSEQEIQTARFRECFMEKSYSKDMRIVYRNNAKPTKQLDQHLATREKEVGVLLQRFIDSIPNNKIGQFTCFLASANENLTITIQKGDNREREATEREFCILTREDFQLPENFKKVHQLKCIRNNVTSLVKYFEAIRILMQSNRKLSEQIEIVLGTHMDKETQALLDQARHAERMRFICYTVGIIAVISFFAKKLY
jgi:hypothetical protein